MDEQESTARQEIAWRTSPKAGKGKRYVIVEQEREYGLQRVTRNMLLQLIHTDPTARRKFS
jgi:hypothetical protein